MSQTNPIEGPRSPEDKSTKKKGAEPDPEKFKELLRTDESDQTKKQKKQTEDLEEELEEQELSDEEIEERASVFQSFMQDNDNESSSLFEGQDTDTTTQPTTTRESSQESYNQMYFPHDSASQSSQDMDDSTRVTSSKPSKSAEKSKIIRGKNQIDTYAKAKELQKKSAHEQELIKAGAKSLKDSSTSLKKATSQELTKKSDKKITKKKSDVLSKSPIKETEKGAMILTPKEDKKELAAQNLLKIKKKGLKEEVKTEKLDKKNKKEIHEPATSDAQDLAQKQIDQESKIGQVETTQEESASNISTSKISSSQKQQAINELAALSNSRLASSKSARNMPVYSTFSKTLFSLFQKLVGLITIESLKGITKTDITLNMKNSIFNGLVVRLDHYDTNPHMFNLNFFCSPQAQEALIANIPNLAQAFEQGNFSFKVNILTPSLLKEQKIKKVEKSTEKDLE